MKGAIDRLVVMTAALDYMEDVLLCQKQYNTGMMNILYFYVTTKTREEENIGVIYARNK